MIRTKKGTTLPCPSNFSTETGTSLSDDGDDHQSDDHRDDDHGYGCGC